MNFVAAKALNKTNHETSRRNKDILFKHVNVQTSWKTLHLSTLHNHVSASFPLPFIKTAASSSTRWVDDPCWHNDKVTSEKQSITLLLLAYYCKLWTPPLQTKPARTDTFPQQLWAAKFVLTRLRLPLTFRQQDHKNSLSLCSYFGLRWMVIRFWLNLGLVVLLITSNSAAITSNPFNSNGTAGAAPRQEVHPGIIGWTLIEANLWSPLSSLEW